MRADWSKSLHKHLVKLAHTKRHITPSEFAWYNDHHRRRKLTQRELNYRIYLNGRILAPLSSNAPEPPLLD